MATNTLSQNVSKVNENKGIYLDFIDKNTPAVLSTELALRFQKKHQHILRDIERICSILPKSFTESNFGRSEYTDPTGRKLPAYLLTRDAFSLLAMGFTGSAAIRWKLAYIEAFNDLEAELLAFMQREQAQQVAIQTERAREAGYQQGMDEARALPAVQAQGKAAYLAGMQEGQRVQKRRDGLLSLEKALDYLSKGLCLADAARLCTVPESTLRQRVQRLRRALDATPNTQGVRA